jgi:nucleotide-binding universal stress UspA family protein
MSVILVPTADRPECAFALDAAFRLADRVDADVTGCHVRRAREEVEPPIDAAEPAEIVSGASLSSAGARHLFAQTAQANGFTVTRRFAPRHRRRAVWHELVGTTARALGIAGPVADFSVVSRPKRESGGRARAFLLSALLDTGRPVLVLPQRRVGSLARRIVIAWNQSVEAAAATTAAIPLLRSAERVVIATSGPENRPGPKSSQLAQYLATFDIETERQSARGNDTAAELQAIYREAEADLLIMGAYSRHRLREILFGGVTEHMLFATNLPVFMLHR